MNRTTQELDHVFGPGAGATDEARARVSKKEFVRSIDQLAESTPSARGRRLTAVEALGAYGWDVLLTVADEGAALLAASATSVGSALRARRELLGLSTRAVGLSARVPEAVVQACEESKRVSIKEYEKVARALGLDERQISVSSEPSGNRDVAVRLRTIGDELPPMTSPVVAAVAEAAWVALQQVRLETLMFGPRTRRFSPEANYGTSSSPAYRVGYKLAGHARDRLGLRLDPIKSLRELTEEQLGIPVIQSELGPDIAGVTLEVEQQRAIVINIGSKNRNVFVRRSTLAHELGHLLFDPAGRLDVLRVDDFEGLSRSADEVPDPVEQRANAFSIEFIAPKQSVAEVYRRNPQNAVAEVMNLFGISFTAARYQLWNALNRTVPLETLRSSRVEPEPGWDGAERYTVDYHPIQGLRASRAGRFSALIMRAANESFLSWDTASEWLECSVEQVMAARDGVRDLFPSVWGTPLSES
jgi:Zn-dependent peptidase ImmA (M78 family)